MHAKIGGLMSGFSAVERYQCGGFRSYSLVSWAGLFYRESYEDIRQSYRDIAPVSQSHSVV